MKTNFTLLLMVFVVSFGFSQEHMEEYFFSEENLLKDSAIIAATPDFIDQRLIAKASHRLSNDIYDSTQYYYAEADDGFYSIYTKYKQTADELQFYSTDTFEFDNQDRVIGSRKFRWDTDLAVFVPEYRSSTEYIGVDVKKRLVQKYDAINSQWKDYWKEKEIYFPDGSLKESTIYNWHDDTDDWSLTSYLLNNEHGFSIESISTFGGTTAYSKRKTFYERDANDRLLVRREMLLDTTTQLYFNAYLQKHVWVGDTLETIYFYHQNNGEWEYETKSISHYNDNDQIVRFLQLDSLDVGLYQNKRLKIYEYTSDGAPLRYQRFNWDEESLNWQLRYNRDYTYDGLLTVRIVSVWNYDSLEILPQYKSVTLSDEHGHLESRRYFSWDKDMADWRFRSRYNWYYEDYENGLVAIQNLEPIALNVYPNPTTEYIAFNMKDVEKSFTVQFYSANGAAIFTTEVSNNQPVRVSHLSAGMYYYIIKGDGVGASGRFVKE